MGLSACYSGSRPGRIGSAAPDFSVRDSEHQVALAQYHGQIVVLNFWATWCAPCVEEVPSLVEMQRRMKAKGVTVLDDPEELVVKIVHKRELKVEEEVPVAEAVVVGEGEEPAEEGAPAAEEAETEK